MPGIMSRKHPRKSHVSPTGRSVAADPFSLPPPQPPLPQPRVVAFKDVPDADEPRAREHLYVFNKRCKGCLYGERRLVSQESADALVESALAKGAHFACHVASIAGKDVACKGFVDERGDELAKVRLGRALGRIVEVHQPPYPADLAAKLEADVRETDQEMLRQADDDAWQFARRHVVGVDMAAPGHHDRSALFTPAMLVRDAHVGRALRAVHAVEERWRLQAEQKAADEALALLRGDDGTLLAGVDWGALETRLAVSSGMTAEELAQLINAEGGDVVASAQRTPDGMQLSLGTRRAGIVAQVVVPRAALEDTRDTTRLMRASFTSLVNHLRGSVAQSVIPDDARHAPAYEALRSALADGRLSLPSRCMSCAVSGASGCAKCKP